MRTGPATKRRSSFSLCRLNVFRTALFATRRGLRFELVGGRLRSRCVLLAFDRAGELILSTFEIAARGEHVGRCASARFTPLLRELGQVTQEPLALLQCARAHERGCAVRPLSRFDLAYGGFGVCEPLARVEERFVERVECTFRRNHPDLGRAPHPILRLHTAMIACASQFVKGCRMLIA
jgi:hypothetical protein